MITIIKNVNTAMQMFPWKKVNVFNVPEKKNDGELLCLSVV